MWPAGRPSGGQLSPTKARLDPSEAFDWKSYVQMTNGKAAMMRSRSHARLVLPPVEDPERPWKVNMAARPPRMRQSRSESILLPRIADVDGFSKVALSICHGDGELRRSARAVPSLAPPPLVASKVHARTKGLQATRPQPRASDVAGGEPLPLGGEPMPSPPPSAQQSRAARQLAAKQSATVKQATEAVNSRFTDMFKAFQYVDLDRSGTLDEKELRRALDLWNIPITDDKLRALIVACDDDGDGQIAYKEFVDVLARDTVTVAAMGKRGMQAMEAMGVADLDREFLGHKNAPTNVRVS